MSTLPPSEDHPGVYVHLPLCRRRCRYCNLRTWPLGAIDLDEMAAALVTEARRTARHPLPGSPPDTLYLGGGSPSLLPPRRIGRLVEQLSRVCDLAPDAEVTIEANPEDVSAAAARTWRSAGINRVSLGVQSLQPGLLPRLDRPDARPALGRAWRALRRAGFDNLSLDLILGLPGETGRGWRAGLEQVLALAPEHLSVYLLEPDAPRLRALSNRLDAPHRPSDDVTAERYGWTIQRLADVGLARYEVSNFARPGRHSRHNAKYWQLIPYWGLGCGAHGFDGRRRTRNLLRLDRWLAAVRARGHGVAHRDAGRDTDRMAEFFFLGLRRTAGVDLGRFHCLFGRPLPPEWARLFEKAVEDGLALMDNDRLMLTDRGLLLSSELFQGLLPG